MRISGSTNEGCRIVSAVTASQKSWPRPLGFETWAPGVHQSLMWPSLSVTGAGTRAAIGVTETASVLASGCRGLALLRLWTTGMIAAIVLWSASIDAASAQLWRLLLRAVPCGRTPRRIWPHRRSARRIPPALRRRPLGVNLLPYVLLVPIQVLGRSSSVGMLLEVIHLMGTSLGRIHRIWVSMEFPLLNCVSCSSSILAWLLPKVFPGAEISLGCQFLGSTLRSRSSLPGGLSTVSTLLSGACMIVFVTCFVSYVARVNKRPKQTGKLTSLSSSSGFIGGIHRVHQRSWSLARCHFVIVPLSFAKRLPHGTYSL